MFVLFYCLDTRNGWDWWEGGGGVSGFLGAWLGKQECLYDGILGDVEVWVGWEKGRNERKRLMCNLFYVFVKVCWWFYGVGATSLESRSW